MFKAEGRIKEARLQTHLAGLELPYKASVVTGASGSYKETDLLEMQEKWLEDWGPGRQWEIWAGDAYAAGLTDNVQRQCWRKGYISMTHGGGATGVTQTNDTELHKPVRARFVEKQTELVLMKTRQAGGGMIDLTEEECITVMATVLSNKDLHLQACQGYKTTGTTVDLNGEEDRLIGKEARIFWDEMNLSLIHI